VDKFQDKESIQQKDFHFPMFLQTTASVVPNPIESPLNVRIRRAVVLIVDFADEKVQHFSYDRIQDSKKNITITTTILQLSSLK
jgi:hypothetical protein